MRGLQVTPHPTEIVCVRRLTHELAAIAQDLQALLLLLLPLLLLLSAAVLASLTLLPLYGFEAPVSSFSHS
jgi:hypothetical protein